MIRILNQEKSALFDFNEKNIFVNDKNIFISDKINIYNAIATIIGSYNDSEEAKFVFERFQEWLEDIDNIDQLIYIYEMPQKEERVIEDENE